MSPVAIDRLLVLSIRVKKLERLRARMAARAQAHYRDHIKAGLCIARSERARRLIERIKEAAQGG